MFVKRIMSLTQLAVGITMLITSAAAFHHGQRWKSFRPWRRHGITFNRYLESLNKDSREDRGKVESKNEKKKIIMRSIPTGQYRSITQDLALSKTAFSRPIPPSTLEYDYNDDYIQAQNQSQDSMMDPMDSSQPKSRPLHTSNNDPTTHMPLRARKTTYNIQKSTSLSNAKNNNKPTSLTNSIESITNRNNTTDVSYINYNTYRKTSDSTKAELVNNDPAFKEPAVTTTTTTTPMSQDPFSRYREYQESMQQDSSLLNTDYTSYVHQEYSNTRQESLLSHTSSRRQGLNSTQIMDASSSPSPSIRTNIPEEQNPENYSNLLKSRLRNLESDMFALNNNKTFNLNSRREISTLLFGLENESINKDVLDALAGSNRVPVNRIAGLLLSHRKLSRQLKNLEKDIEVTALGVQSGRLSPETLDSMIPVSFDVSLSRILVEDKSNIITSASNFHDSDPLMLVDASAYIFRAYYSMPPIHRSDGMPVGAVLGFCNMVNNLVLDAYIHGKRPRLALVFDSKEGTSVRKTLYPQYKANRPPCPEDLIPQFDLIKGAADAYGIMKIEAPGHEADDVIATLAMMAQKDGCKVNIYSGDKDLMQLITKDGKITMMDPMKLTSTSYNAVLEKWNVPPEKLGDVLALAGDSSDNIPGVPGIGPKTAASLINEFGSLDALLSNMDSIKQKVRREKLIENIDSIAISRRLVQLETGIPIENMTLPDDFTISDIRMEARSLVNEERLLQFYSDMGFKDITRRVQGRLYKDSRTIIDPPSGNFRKNVDASISTEETVTMDPTGETVNTSLRNIAFTSPRPKPPPGPMEYDDVPF